jgi:DNA-binding beta-propeller fold protein YncE
MQRGEAVMRAQFAVTVALVVATAAFSQYLETTIPLPGGEPCEPLWNPASDRVYCPEYEGSTVTIVDCATNAVRAVLDVADSPTRCIWNSRHNKVYCLSGEANRITVIDGVGDSVLRRVVCPGYPYGGAYCEALNKLYACCADDRRIRVFDGATDELVGSISLPLEPAAVVWSPTSNRVFCTIDGDSDTVVVIDCVTDEIVARHAVGIMSRSLCWNPVNSLVYEAGHYDAHVFSADGDSLVADIGTGAHSPFVMAAVPYPNKVYVGDANGFGIQVMDGNTNTIVDTLPSATGYGIYCDRVRGKVYTVGDDSAHVYDARTDSLLTTVLYGHYMVFIAGSPTQGRAYVTEDWTGLVHVIRDTSTAVAEPPSSAPRPVSSTTVVRQGWLTCSDSGGGRLLDAAGRSFMVLKPGNNDVSRLPAGVYFVADTAGACVTKVLVPR